MALRGSQSPLNARKLARRQNLPERFLEIILNELKQGGFVQSIRGKAGGYILARPATEITIGQLLGFLENRSAEKPSHDEVLPVPGQFVLSSLIQQANTAIGRIFDCCTLEELVQREMVHRGAFEANYVI